jgi:hypothetical protein
VFNLFGFFEIFKIRREKKRKPEGNLRETEGKGEGTEKSLRET